MTLLKGVVVDPINFLNFRPFPSLLIATFFPSPISLPPFKAFTSAYNSSPTAPSAPLENPLKAFAELLKSSSKTSTALSEVEFLHSRAIKVGFARDGEVGTGLLNLYVKCGSLGLARKLFGEISHRGVLEWTILISGYSRSGENEMGFRLFVEMIAERILPNEFTLASVLKCCTGFSDIENGKTIHGWMIRNGIGLDVVLQNSILDLYAKCGDFENVKRAFHMMTERDTVSWNILIGAYLQNGDVCGSMDLFRESPFQDVSTWNTIISGQIRHGFDLMALKLLYQMMEIGPRFNQLTFSIALALAGTLALLELGRQLHNQILRTGYEHDAFIRNSLIDMYCKCGKIEASSFIFNSSSLFADCSTAKTISWSTLIAGYVQNARDEEALEFFRKMLREGVVMDQFSLTSSAAACSNTGILEQGRQVHVCVIKLGHGSDVHLTSALTDMYSKCGSLEDARKTFGSISSRNVVLWTTMLCSYAMHGQGRLAIQIFEKMLEEKIMPNAISFTGVLSACSHSKFVKEGYGYFKSMKEDYGIVPCIEHYTCMVDLFGRAGLLDEAKKFIYENNISNHAVIWKAFLSACRVHTHIEYANLASEQLVKLEPHDAGSYILLSNIYATKRKWEDTHKLRNVMQERGVRKQPGRSWIYLKNTVHTFTVGDVSHPKTDEIYTYLESVIGRLKEMGYSSRTDLVLHDLEEEQRESALNFHSEKLAIAFGIISTPAGTPLRIMKNLRVCTDCHEAIKYISQVTNREIIVRDSYRFHHFKDAKCSCEDFW
ncbi:pentatricopeptide repeat-containing protein At2g03880, mitochondrial-like [Typha latifolia]|uniref:pentatricopeptide repeat-containing protein At2g03880, mitochondrial-like n=1 Tax=Typha latifolia TaxID=4733 RepID=UPI003C2AB694